MKKFNKYILALIVITVVVMTIGYSALNSELNITGDVNYRPEKDVRITSFTTSEKPSEMTVEYADFSKHEIKLGYTTTGECSITYTVKVENFSAVNMGILSISGLDGNIEVQKDIIGKKLVGPASSNTFTITFKPTTAEIKKTYLLTFNFKQVFTVTYNGFSNIDDYKKEIFMGEEYSQNFGSSAPKNIEVTMNGEILNTYSYTSGILTIPNVSGNLVINGNNAPSFKDSCENHPNAPVLNGDMIPVVYDEENQTWVKQDLSKSYDYCNQVWANAVTVKNTVKDLSGNNNDGLIRGNAIIGNGEATLDGVDDYINCGLYRYDFKSEISYVVKIRNESDTKGLLIGNWDAGGGGLNIYAHDKIFFELYVNDGYKYVYGVLKSNDYNTIVATYDGSDMKLYINGELAGSTPVVGSIKLSTASMSLGANLTEMDILDSSTTARVNINDVLVFNKALSDDEIKAHYSNEVSLGQTQPLLYYNFEDASREYYKKANNGTSISMDDINTMWVWIPRYSYTIQGPYGRGGASTALPGAIDIKFLSETDPIESGKANYIGNEESEWKTPDAFNFGRTTQAGIWVGKFETAGELASACTSESCTVNKLSIKPDMSSLRSQKVSSFFYAARSMQNDTATFGFSDSGDLHMMKNDEWGAVAYLSQSKYGKYGNTDYTGPNKEIYQNKSDKYITGSSNGTPSQNDTKNPQYAYNNMTELGDGKGQAGPGASTTGNIYGIYDMSGGTWEYVMGVLAYNEDDTPMSGKSTTSNSGFNGKVYESGAYDDFINYSFPDNKYFNLYKVGTKVGEMPSSSTLTNSQKACDGGICYGQALSETTNWYGDGSGFVYRELPWPVRGGYFSYTTVAGVFGSSSSSGNAHSTYGSRFVFAP